MLNNVLIKNADINDIDELYAFERGIFTHDQLSKRQIRYHIKHKQNQFLVVKVADTIVGYCLIFCIFGRYSYARIYSIAVAPEFQKKKIAAQLMQKALIEIKNNKINKVYLEVAEDNLTAINFYKNFKFTVIKTIPLYYQGKYNALKMQKIM